MKTLFLALLVSQTPAFAAEQCFQVSADQNNWSTVPELLCIEGTVERKPYMITLKTGLPDDLKVVATFTLDLLNRDRCTDCNLDQYGLASPVNSVFNKLAIKFDGKRDAAKMKEAGTVSIGETKFFYRSL